MAEPKTRPSSDVTLAGATIVVAQDRLWVGDPRLGAFSVSINGKRVGKVPIHDSVTVPVAAGQHSVRIRQWWFRSAPLTVDIKQGETVRVKGDIPHTSFLARTARLTFAPSSALVLTRAE